MSEQKSKLASIKDRLKGLNFLDPETLAEVVDSLMSEEGWTLARVLAHLDMIDHDERT